MGHRYRLAELLLANLESVCVQGCRLRITVDCEQKELWGVSGKGLGAPRNAFEALVKSSNDLSGRGPAAGDLVLARACVGSSRNTPGTTKPCT